MGIIVSDDFVYLNRKPMISRMSSLVSFSSCSSAFWGATGGFAGAGVGAGLLGSTGALGRGGAGGAEFF